MYKDRLYDAFAELIYTVAMADGVIKESEKRTISGIIKNHPIGKDIERYFSSGLKDMSVAQPFLHTMEVCKEYGRDEEYPFLLHIVD